MYAVIDRFGLRYVLPLAEAQTQARANFNIRVVAKFTDWQSVESAAALVVEVQTDYAHRLNSVNSWGADQKNQRVEAERKLAETQKALKQLEGRLSDSEKARKEEARKWQVKFEDEQLFNRLEKSVIADKLTKLQADLEAMSRQQVGLLHQTFRPPTMEELIAANPDADDTLIIGKGLMERAAKRRRVEDKAQKLKDESNARIRAAVAASPPSKPRTPKNPVLILNAPKETPK